MVMSAARPLQALPIPIVLLGEQRLACEAIASLLNQSDELNVVYGSASDAITPLRRIHPQVALLDIGLRREDSLRVAAQVKHEFPDIKVIAMDELPIHEDIVDFVNAGVSGFILKDDPVDDLVNAIHLVETGKSVLPQAMVKPLFSRIAGESLVRSRSGPVRMTPRELEVIHLIAAGLSNKEIAARLNVATHTVKSHVRNVMEKLTVHTRLQIAAFAFSHGDP